MKIIYLFIYWFEKKLRFNNLRGLNSGNFNLERCPPTSTTLWYFRNGVKLSRSSAPITGVYLFFSKSNSVVFWIGLGERADNSMGTRDSGESEFSWNGMLAAQVLVHRPLRSLGSDQLPDPLVRRETPAAASLIASRVTLPKAIPRCGAMWQGTHYHTQSLPSH